MRGKARNARYKVQGKHRICPSPFLFPFLFPFPRPLWERVRERGEGVRRTQLQIRNP